MVHLPAHTQTFLSASVQRRSPAEDFRVLRFTCPHVHVERPRGVRVLQRQRGGRVACPQRLHAAIARQRKAVHARALAQAVQGGAGGQRCGYLDVLVLRRSEAGKTERCMLRSESCSASCWQADRSQAECTKRAQHSDGRNPYMQFTESSCPLVSFSFA